MQQTLLINGVQVDQVVEAEQEQTVIHLVLQEQQNLVVEVELVLGVHHHMHQVARVVQV